MLFLAPLLPVLTTLTLWISPEHQAESDELFPASTALAEGVSPEALDALSQLIQELVDEEEIVGGELMVLKNGRTILNEAYGLRDRESETAMETGNVYCVRSMTKPFISTSILMLLEEGKLKLNERVSQYLPAFDVEALREITIEQLLQHTSGLTMSLLLAQDLKALDGIGAVAALATDVEFAPGTNFNYSDQGTDTLTAVVEVVSGMTPAEFVTARVLDPLGMEESACVMSEDSPLRDRACPKYAGTRGNWTRFWSTEDPPLFPFFLGSQALYSTVKDYARFMKFWQDKGRVGRKRLLKPSSVRKALKPGPFAFQSPTGFPELRVDYGYLMQLWTGEGEDGDREVVAFGHTGSDGTHAWVFPEQDAMVLYFTQSRNNSTGLRVEEAIGQLFLGAPFDANQAAPPFEEYLGYYWEGEGDLYRAIIRDGDDLALEVMGKGIVPLSFIGNDRWKMRPNPSVVLAFDRAEDGTVSGYHIGDHQEFRFEPASDFPSGDEVAALVAKTHRLDLLETIGPIRMKFALDFEKLGIKGEASVVLAAPGHFRYDAIIGEETEQLAFDGTDVWSSTTKKPVEKMSGDRLELMRLDNSFARFGNLTEWHPSLRVIQRLQPHGEEVWVVRGGDTSGPAMTLYVHASSGRVVAEDGFIFADMMGRMGRHIEFNDFREFEGMLIPYQTETVLAHPLIGPIYSTVHEIEVGIELADGTFRLE